MAESFWSTLKTEFYDRQRWPTRDAARKAVAYWMEVVYNRRRRHSARECLMVCVWVPNPHEEMDQNDYCGETRSG